MSYRLEDIPWFDEIHGGIVDERDTLIRDQVYYFFHKESNQVQTLYKINFSPEPGYWISLSSEEPDNYPTEYLGEGKDIQEMMDKEELIPIEYTEALLRWL